MPEVITGQDGSMGYETGAVSEETARVEAARAELFDEATGQAGTSEDGLLLGKYKSADDLAEAYKSLQAEYTRLKAGGPAAEPVTQSEQQPATEQADTESSEPKSPQIDEAKAKALTQRVLELAGGEAGYQRLANWVASTLPAERVNSWNDVLKTGDENTIVSSLKGLQYDYMMANGYEPRLTGGRAPSNEVRGYSSQAQVVEAMSDPRYSGDNRDESYVREVERRMAASEVFEFR